MNTLTCTSCQQECQRKVRGWCPACYMRWLRAGKPAGGPPRPPQPKPPFICASCGGQERKHIARGWCSACYFRWLRAGKPADGPPSPSSASSERQYRISEYAFLLSCGERRESAAARVGVSLWTACQYEKELVAA